MSEAMSTKYNMKKLQAITQGMKDSFNAESLPRDCKMLIEAYFRRRCQG